MTAPRTDPQSTVPVEPLSARWFHVGRPWSHAPGLIYAGAEDPHAGTFVVDCRDWPDETHFGDVQSVDVAALADGIVRDHNDRLDAARASQPVTATADSGEPIELAELLREFRLRSSLEYNKSEASRLAWATAYDMLAVLPVREDEPTGIDVERLGQAMKAAGQAEHPDGTLWNEHTVKVVAGYIASEYDRLTREASHVR